MICELFNFDEFKTGNRPEDFHHVFLDAIAPPMQMHGHALFHFLREFSPQSFQIIHQILRDVDKGQDFLLARFLLTRHGENRLAGVEVLIFGVLHLASGAKRDDFLGRV